MHVNKKTRVSVYVALTAAMAATAVPTVSFATVNSKPATAEVTTLSAKDLGGVFASDAQVEKKGGVIATVTSFPNGQTGSVAKEVTTVEELQAAVKAAVGGPAAINLKRDVELPSGFEISGPANGFAVFGEGHKLSVAGSGTLVMNTMNVAWRDITLDCADDTLLVKPVAGVNFLFCQQNDVKGALGKVKVDNGNGQVIIQDLGGENLNVGGIEGFEGPDGKRNTLVQLDSFGSSATPHLPSNLKNLAGVQLEDSHIKIEGDASELGAIVFGKGDNSVTVAGNAKVDGLVQNPNVDGSGKAQNVYLENGATLEVGKPQNVGFGPAKLQVVVKGELPSEGTVLSFADKAGAPEVSFVDGKGNPIDSIKKDGNGNYVVPAAPKPEPAPQPTPQPEPTPQPTPRPEPAPQPTPKPEPAPQPLPAPNNSANQQATGQGKKPEEVKPAKRTLPQTGDPSMLSALGAVAVGVSGGVAAGFGAVLRRRGKL